MYFSELYSDRAIVTSSFIKQFPQAGISGESSGKFIRNIHILFCRRLRDNLTPSTARNCARAPLDVMLNNVKGYQKTV